MRLLPKSIHWCRRYPTKFNSGRDIPFISVSLLNEDEIWFVQPPFGLGFSCSGGSPPSPT